MTDVSPPQAATGRLFSPNAVGIATFLGSPIAGGIVLALNYRALGKAGAAWAAVGATIAATALLMFAGAKIQLGSANTGVAVGVAFGMVAVAKGLQGKAFEAHIAGGGTEGSSWLAAGIALPFLVAMVFLIVKFGFPPDIGERYDFGGDQAVYYDDGVTRKQAGQVGKLLGELGYFDDSGPKHVLTRRDGDTYVVSFVLRDDVQITPQLRDAFREVGDIIAERAFGGDAVDVLLVDSDLDELP